MVAFVPALSILHVGCDALSLSYSADKTWAGDPALVPRLFRLIRRKNPECLVYESKGIPAIAQKFPFGPQKFSVAVSNFSNKVTKDLSKVPKSSF